MGIQSTSAPRKACANANYKLGLLDVKKKEVGSHVKEVGGLPWPDHCPEQLTLSRIEVVAKQVGRKFGLSEFT